MKACLFTLCESSLAALPDKGKSEFVRKAILAFCPASPSKGEEAAMKPYNPAEWKRENGFPILPKHDAYKVTDMVWRDGVCINSPPLYDFAGLSAYDGAVWIEYVRQWRMLWRDPWPTLREWEAMGKPRKPSEGHRVSVEPAIVEPAIVEPAIVPPVAVEPAIVPPVAVEPAIVPPVAVEPAIVPPVAVEPVIVPPVAVAVNPPLQGGGVSCNVLDEI